MATTTSARPFISRALLRIAGPAAIYLLATVLSRAASILLIPLYTRSLSLSDYGDYALAQTLVNLGAAPISLGMSAAVIRFYFEKGDVAVSRARAGSAARWLVLLVIGLVAAIALGIVATRPADSHGLYGRWELLCMTWSAGGYAIGWIPGLYFRNAQRPVLAACFQLGEFFVTLAAGLLMVLVLGRGLRGAIEATALAASVLAAASIVYILTSMKGPLDTRTLREALRFSLPFVPHTAGNQIQLVSDRWTLKLTGYGEALGGYSIASQLTTPISMIISSWNDAASPMIGEAYRQDGMQGIASRYGRFQRSFPLVALAAGIAVCVALPILSQLVAPAFRGALWIVPFFCASFVVESLYYPNSVVLFYANRTDLIPKVTLTAGILNVILAIVLVTLIGVPGALASRMLSMGFRSGAMWWLARPFVAAPTATPGPSNGA